MPSLLQCALLTLYGGHYQIIVVLYFIVLYCIVMYVIVLYCKSMCCKVTSVVDI